MSEKHVIAVDLGAESGRVMKVLFDGKILELEQVHRFPNRPVTAAGTLYWDVLGLWHEIQMGIDAALNNAMSIGVDTWGVDFALLDRNGQLLANPVHYRDNRTNGMMEWVFERVPKRTIFDRTGIQFMQLNTLYQLASLVRDHSPLLEAADTFLTIADLFNYWLGGEQNCEFTFATTTQFYNPRTHDWDRETLGELHIPLNIFPRIVAPGSPAGEFRGIPLIKPACHDTGSAVVAVPASDDNFAYLSSGTWSLFGLEISEPVINDRVYEANLTNEGGAGNTFRLLKNVMGLWLDQQCRATWKAAGNDYTFDELTALAAEAESFRSLIDPDDLSFLPPGDMPARIREYCQHTGQPLPESVGQIMRTIYESLAFKYRVVLDDLIDLTGKTVERLHIIGGGSQNKLLCQMTADAIGRQVVAGPVEATALGNGIVQLITLGELDNIAQARDILRATTGMIDYEPQNTSIWDETYQRFKQLIAGSDARR
ncbi:MAG: rhamnulokinase [Chloroflexi bacterium]|nr:MAG: rhamnulokinase [Phototrophicales bacterium]RMF79667.1 MAG: rhamnulokinase [Chloroflexota bacterium]